MARLVMNRSRVVAAARNGALALVFGGMMLHRLSRFFHKGWEARAAAGS